MHTLPELGYAYDALEPYIDEQTMKIHHTKHHQTYVDKLNAALEKYPELQKKPAIELIKDLNKIPDDIRTAVRNHGGGHVNHSFWWPLLKKNIPLTPKIERVLKENFGSYETFKEEFNKTTLSLFGSGWCWLIIDNDQLKIMITSNQDNPISQGKIPILGIDMWEHSFYLKHGPNKQAYIEDFFNVINWKQVEENYNNAVNINEEF